MCIRDSVYADTLPVLGKLQILMETDKMGLEEGLLASYAHVSGPHGGRSSAKGLGQLPMDSPLSILAST